MNNTSFDKIVRKEIPVDIVYEDDSILAFKDINPRAPIHVLVIPKHRISRIAEASEWSAEMAGRFLQGVIRVAKELKLEESGYRIVVNNGHDGGQEVEYLHAHILGGKRLSWPPC